MDAATLKSRRTTDTDAKLDSPQVLLAGQDGTIYIMIDFEVSSPLRDNGLGNNLVPNILVDLFMDSDRLLY
jgi:hypothetical protein